MVEEKICRLEESICFWKTSVHEWVEGGQLFMWTNLMAHARSTSLDGGTSWLSSWLLKVKWGGSRFRLKITRTTSETYDWENVQETFTWIAGLVQLVCHAGLFQASGVSGKKRPLCENKPTRKEKRQSNATRRDISKTDNCNKRFKIKFMV